MAATIAVLFLVAVAAIGYSYVWTTTAKPLELNRSTLCPLDGPASTLVVLLDASDDFPDVARQEVELTLNEMASSVPTHGLVELRTLTAGAPYQRILFSKCNPGDGKGLSEYTANPKMARQKWEKEFSDPLKDALRGGLAPAPGEASPIMSAIQRISLERFMSSSTASTPKSLVLVSDMIEFTPAYSQYTNDLTYDRFRRSPAYRSVRTDLKQAEVTIFYVQRQTRNPINPAAHIKFWQEWIIDNGGVFHRAKTLQGVR
ncbi:hypothetical protein PY365_12365 [Roseiarcaceae bacterium H3SJ34-1]|uniref:hypothetical protein n=1 Tax=Terripilifer ovatus TaxID=3032367 RepID=UPI003AB9510F|nr:hypothetical protein [Roseiarcaceae bacterium H3SJ34-1]